MKTPQSDSLYRHIVKACGTKDRREVVVAAFAKAREQGGTGNAIGDLEVICIRFLAEVYTDELMAQRAKR